MIFLTCYENAQVHTNTDLLQMLQSSTAAALAQFTDMTESMEI